mgnify:CR=1 FL=1
MLEIRKGTASKNYENTFFRECKAEILTKEVVKNVKETATIYTDECLGYKDLKRIYDHSVVKHNRGEYVNGRIHTNTIEGFWS